MYWVQIHKVKRGPSSQTPVLKVNRYSHLPRLPNTYVSSFDPLGRPFAFVNMFDPQCLTTKPRPGSAQRVYAVLVQTPRYAECQWRLPPEVVAFMFSKCRAKKHKRSVFDLHTGEALVKPAIPDSHCMTSSGPMDIQRILYLTSTLVMIGNISEHGIVSKLENSSSATVDWNIVISSRWLCVPFQNSFT